jgi:hypothetical protein
MLECQLHLLKLLRRLGSQSFVVFESVWVPHIAEIAVSLLYSVTRSLWRDTQSGIVLSAFFATYA